MFTPRAFRETDRARLYALIEDYDFGLLISARDGTPRVTHLPFMLRRDPDRLLTHVARANAHWRDFEANGEAMCVFQGPHAYISPGWYANQDTVPTWNYAAVHVRGRARLLDERELRELVTALTAAHEAAVASGWDQRRAKIDPDIRYIVGIEIAIDRIEGKFKFNQNLSTADRRGVVEALSRSEDSTERAVAAWMRANEERLGQG